MIGNAVERTYPTAVPFNAGGSSVFALDTNRVLETLQFQLSGQLTNSGWTTAPVKRVEGIENLVRNLTIEGASKGVGLQSDTFASVDAAYLAFQTRAMEATAPARVDAGALNATYAFLSTFKRYFGLKRHVGAYAVGFLDTRFLNTLNLTVNWRDVNALIQPATGAGPGTSVLSGVQIAVHAIEWLGTAPTIRKAYLKQAQRKFDLTNLSGLNVPFLNAPVGQFMPRQTFKTTVGDVDYADPSNSVLVTSAQAKGAFIRTSQDDSFDWRNSSVSQIQAQMKTDYQIEQVPIGYTTYEYSRTKNLEGDLNLTKARTLTNYIDLTTVAGSVNTLQITDEQVVVRQ